MIMSEAFLVDVSIYNKPVKIRDCGRAKHWEKVSLVKAKPLPISKIKNDCMNDVVRC